MQQAYAVDRVALVYGSRTLWEAPVPPTPRPWTIELPARRDDWPEYAELITCAGELVGGCYMVRLTDSITNRLTLTRADATE